MKRTLFVLSLCLLLSPAAVKADIISFTGDVTVVAPPSSVDLTDTGAAALLFAEQSLVLSSPLAVDISAPGSYASLASLTFGTIAPGTDVSSYYLHTWYSTDILGTVYSGSITFSTPILGVEALSPSLVNTNSLLGSPTTTYTTFVLNQGYEFGTQIDSLTISGDTLTFLNETYGKPDDLRIITATSVPEPSTLLMLGTGLLGIGGVFRRKFLP